MTAISLNDRAKLHSNFLYFVSTCETDREYIIQRYYTNNELSLLLKSTLKKKAVASVS